MTSRADLAQALVKEATQPRFSRSIMEVISKTGPPSPARTFLKEIVGRKRSPAAEGSAVRMVERV